MDSEDSDLDVWEVANGYVGRDWLMARNMIRSAARALGYAGFSFEEFNSHKDEINVELIKRRLKNG